MFDAALLNPLFHYRGGEGFLLILFFFLFECRAFGLSIEFFWGGEFGGGLSRKSSLFVF